MNSQNDSIVIVKLHAPPAADRLVKLESPETHPFTRFRRVHLGNGKYGMRAVGIDERRAALNGHQALPRQQQQQGSTRPEIYVQKSTFLVRNDDGEFVVMTETLLRRRLKLKGIAKANIPIVIENATQQRQIDLHTPLAGHAAGFQTNCGIRLLVTRSTPLIEARKGEWGTIAELVDNMLGTQQKAFFFAWLKCALWRLRAHEWVPLQSVILAGDPNAGKTILINKIIAPALGGRMASPFDYMIGKTPFNEDLASAELLVLDDEQSSGLRDKDQSAISDFLKFVAVKPTHRVAPKGQKARQLNLTTTAIVATNLEPQNLKVVPPPFENDMAERVHVFKCFVKEMPMSVSTTEDKLAFSKQLHEELPAFLYHVEHEFETTNIASKNGRFPCRTFQHPDVVALIVGDSKFAAMRDMIFVALRSVNAFTEKKEIWLSSAQLKKTCELPFSVQEIGNLMAAWKRYFPTEIRDRKKQHDGSWYWRIVSLDYRENVNP